MVPAFGIVILPQNPSTENRQIAGWRGILSVCTRVNAALRIVMGTNPLNLHDHLGILQRLAIDLPGVTMLVK